MFTIFRGVLFSTFLNSIFEDICIKTKTIKFQFNEIGTSHLNLIMIKYLH